MTTNTWLPMLGQAAAAAAAAATMLARRKDRRRVSHLLCKARIKSWENEGGSLATEEK